ncbi:hypothetical protein ACKKBG_A25800 [Auxenochlorella protothecoides x Auxenochlorella symbiontica]
MTTRHRLVRDEQRATFSGNVRLWEKQPTHLGKEANVDILVVAWTPTEKRRDPHSLKDSMYKIPLATRAERERLQNLASVVTKAPSVKLKLKVPALLSQQQPSPP